MKYFFTMILSNLYKLFHTKQLWAHSIIAILGIAVFCGYYSYSPWEEADKVLVFLQSVAMVFPLSISIVVTMFYEEERKAGSFQTTLTLPSSKWIAHLGNLIALCIFGGLTCIFSIVGFGVVFRMMGYLQFPILLFCKLSVIMFLSNIALYCLQYLICFTYGNGFSLGFGIVGSLFSPLLYLGLGDIIWKYIPFGFGIRLAPYYLLQYMDTQAYRSILPEFKSGIFSAGILTMVLILGFCIWSNFWQDAGQKID